MADTVAATGSRVTLPFPKDPKYGTGERCAALNLLAAGRLSDTNRGPAIAGVEDAFAALTGSRYALSFNSGTASLHAAVHAAGASPDAGVITSPLTWISAIMVAFQAGSYPIFCDVEPDGINLDPHRVAAIAYPSAILVTHAWGVPARMDTLMQLARVPVVEDCSHAHGARYAGRPVGSWGQAGCFSLMERKPVSGGEGGVLTTDDRRFYELAMTVGHHPHRLTAELTEPDLLPLASTGLGYKTRMPALAAAIATANLRGLPGRMAAAETNLATLRTLLHDTGAPVAIPALPPDSSRGWYGTPLRITQPVPDPDALRTACHARGLPIRNPYDDWLRSPLLRDTDLLVRRFPHVRHTPYSPPDPDAFPHYTQARRQTLVLKIPDVPASAYMQQVGSVLDDILCHRL